MMDFGDLSVGDDGSSTQDHCALLRTRRLTATLFKAGMHAELRGKRTQTPPFLPSGGINGGMHRSPIWRECFAVNTMEITQKLSSGTIPLSSRASRHSATFQQIPLNALFLRHFSSLARDAPGGEGTAHQTSLTVFCRYRQTAPRRRYRHEAFRREMQKRAAERTALRTRGRARAFLARGRERFALVASRLSV